MKTLGAEQIRVKLMNHKKRREETEAGGSEETRRRLSAGAASRNVIMKLSSYKPSDVFEEPTSCLYLINIIFVLIFSI